MAPSTAYGFRKKRYLAGVALCGALSAVAVLECTPAARHWTRAAASRVLHGWTVTAAHRPKPKAGTAESVVAVRPDPKLVAEAQDGRFAWMSVSTLAAPSSPVTADGFIGLLPSIDAKTAAATVSLEHATLPRADQQAAVVAPATAADFASAHQAITFYRQGSLVQGDEFAKTVSDPVVKTALAWVALRYDPREAGVARIQAFMDGHPDWPTLPWLGRRVEELTISNNPAPAAIQARFAAARPQTLTGRLALARADLATGDVLTAAGIVRDVWRNADITLAEETAISREFGTLIGRDDHKFRADRLLYKEQVAPALRVAVLAGGDVRLLASARASVINQAGDRVADTALAAVPLALANDPGLIFSRIQKARRAGRIADAVVLLNAAPRDPATLIDGDAWWVERRLLARKMLDLGDAKTAYTICAGHAAMSDASTIEAEFHAGWIALRFLNDPKLAATHFARAASVAETPISRARVAYWQGRAADSSDDKAAATAYYTEAAAQPISFYGQLAGARIGRTTIDLRQPTAKVDGDDRREAIRVVEQLYAMGEQDIALPLALDIAKTETSDAQVAALAAVLTKADDARATLLVGKLGTQRGLAIDESAFPTFGIPGYQPLTNSADRAVVYAIARQESEFNPRSVSSAGAKGLMQLIASTARQTATKLGVSYDDNRLSSDAAFNAQIGAAHLGQLLTQLNGSYILTFAAYNAGPQRVKDWIEAYGDPRKPGVDPIDWIERIPFTETRNYVQRVFENLQVYRLRFGPASTQLVGADFAQHGKGT